LPRKTSSVLTEAELRLMDVFWRKGPSTVQHVMESLPEDQPLAYNSVLTTVRILEKKGYLAHEKDGRAHIYRPEVQREEASRSEVSHLLNRFFKNSRELLVLNLLEDDSLDASELKRLRRLVESQSASSGGK
jgi:BlaI family transcriptional regulator, penicillinase repressor